MLIGHPEVNLKAVTVTPGAPDQIGLVRKVLSKFNLEIPIGSFNIDHPKQCVSIWYNNAIKELYHRGKKMIELESKTLYKNKVESTVESKLGFFIIMIFLIFFGITFL